VHRGECLVVHSSFNALGLREAAPVDVIRTLLEALGDQGTLMMPTFTYSFAGIYGVEPFNPLTSPGLGNGVLSETLQRYPGVLRSAQPAYSVAAIGRQAQQLTRDKEKASMLGIGSSYHEAYELGSKILLLGVGNIANSMLHTAETLAGLPYQDIPVRAFWGRTALVEQDGREVELLLPVEYPGCSLGFGGADAYLQEKGVLQRGQVCAAECMLMEARSMVAVVVERLQQEPDWLLCHNFACEPCNLRRHRLHAMGWI